MPQIKEMFDNAPQYLTRITLLRGIQAFGISDATYSTQLLTDITELCVKALDDSVPNVKFVACQALEEFCKKKCLDVDVVANQIKPALEKLTASSDSDVQFYARAALAQCA
jgi:hypothetical protein